MRKLIAKLRARHQAALAQEMAEWQQGEVQDPPARHEDNDGNVAAWMSGMRL